MIATNAPTRPVCRYHGGKFRIRESILEHFPKHKVYVEPFGGAGSILMAKSPSNVEVYNDTEGNIVNLFRILRDPEQSRRLQENLELTPFSLTEFMDCQYSIDKSDDPVENARRYLTVSLQCIGNKHRNERTGWRTATINYNGSPAVSFNNYPSQLPVFCARLKEVIIDSRPALEIFDIYDAPCGVLFYVDPPYMLGTRQLGYRKVYENEMSDDDHAQLLAKLKTLKGMVLLSGYRSELYDLELRDWKRVDIAARAQTNAPRTECLWISPNTPNGGLFA
jgi:DNA adenine methylase